MRESLTATAAYRVETWSATQQFFEVCLGDRGRDRGPEAVRLLLDDGRDDVARVVCRREADEPRVVDDPLAELRGARLAGDPEAGRETDGRGRSALDDELHHLVQLAGGPRLDRPAEGVRRRPGHEAAVVRDDAIDEVGLQLLAAVRDRLPHHR